jgi:hypothetical protein
MKLIHCHAWQYDPFFSDTSNVDELAPKDFMTLQKKLAKALSEMKEDVLHT